MKHFFFFLLLLPAAFAEEEAECGIINIIPCLKDLLIEVLPQILLDFIEELINAPLQPLLDTTKILLTEQVSIEPFFSVWSIILYILGFFYLLLLTFTALSFVTSGHDVIKRENAKEWLKNTILVIIFTSLSFYLYDLVLAMSAVLAGDFISAIPEDFFRLTLDSFANVIVSLLMMFTYLIFILVSVLFLAIRYAITSIGVLFVPIAIFCYFIPPLKSYGNVMLNLLGLAIFTPVICSLIFLACSMLLTIPLYAWFKILIMISAFALVDLILIIMIWHIVNKAAISHVKQRVVKAGKYIAALM